MREGDGGREVHELHAALERHGFYAHDEDRLWWQFGYSTLNALKTFQVGRREGARRLQW